MIKTITRLFDNYADALAAVGKLEALGVPHNDISLVANNADGSHSIDNGQGGVVAVDGVRERAVIGAVIGGTSGLLAGLSMLAIPGLGPVVAAGWLISTAAGVGAVAAAATGGLIGALLNAGENEVDARVYFEGVRRGGTLISARVSDTFALKAEAVLARHRSVTASTLGREYRAGGWNSFGQMASQSAIGSANGTAVRFPGLS